jgi:hypothetical protein
LLKAACQCGLLITDLLIADCSRNPQSAIRNGHAAIRNPQSAIGHD